jgi:hypothetical protein
VSSLTVTERLKFKLLAEGVRISDRAAAFLAERNEGRALTPADYASTSGVILALPDDVWVNAPTVMHNPNFVDDTANELDLDVAESQLYVRSDLGDVPTLFWIPPAYHDAEPNGGGRLATDAAFTHGDRVRLSPIDGCNMTCQFCDLPYTSRYHTKRIDGIVDALHMALSDDVQPAHHVLISGGTPRDADVEYVKDVYRAVVGASAVPVDIMMVPIPDLMDPTWLAEIGVNEVSVNLEIFNETLAARIMAKKAKQGLPAYLDYFERAAEALGPGRVRSMLMVGLEPMEDTLAGVEAIAKAGAVPVLSPFRPDPDTPLRSSPPPSAEVLEETFLRARELAGAHSIALGPSCIPCSHNTLTLGRTGGEGAYRYFGRPILV